MSDPLGLWPPGFGFYKRDEEAESREAGLRKEIEGLLTERSELRLDFQDANADIEELKSRLESVQKSEREAVEVLEKIISHLKITAGKMAEYSGIYAMVNKFLASREKAGETTGTGQ